MAVSVLLAGNLILTHSQTVRILLTSSFCSKIFGKWCNFCWEQFLCDHSAAQILFLKVILKKESFQRLVTGGRRKGEGKEVSRSVAAVRRY